VLNRAGVVAFLTKQNKELRASWSRSRSRATNPPLHAGLQRVASVDRPLPETHITLQRKHPDFSAGPPLPYRRVRRGRQSSGS
jgi:hypothetical protein